MYLLFSIFLSLPQGYPGEKGTAGSSDIIDFNGKLLDAFQVSDIKVSMRPDGCGCIMYSIRHLLLNLK